MISLPDAPYIRNMETYGTPYPDDEAAIAFHCDNCGEGILEDEAYYELFDMRLCETCVDNAKRYAERDYE